MAELAGLAHAMRELASVRVTRRDDLLDTAGTGGGRPTFNVSTTAAFVAAGAGCRVAKHGNRSATGRSGSADVLEALGARIDLEPEAVAECIDELGFGFMFAPAPPPGHAATWCRCASELGVRTIFNFLGPLTNPAGATRQLIGVSDPRYLDTIAEALGELGGRRALVVSSEDGLDEAQHRGRDPGRRAERRADRALHDDPRGRSAWTRSPGRGRRRRPRAERRDGAPRCSDGEPGAPSAILTVANAARGDLRRRPGDSLADGARAAEQAIDSGAAGGVLERFVARTRELAAPMNERLDALVAGHARARCGSAAAAAAGRARARASAERRDDDRPFAEALARPGTSVIAEYKRRSPSAGVIREGASVGEIARPTSAAALPRCRYSPRGTTSAVRSTTCARRGPASDLPILRKDFTVDPYSCYEAKAERRRRRCCWWSARCATSSLADLLRRRSGAGPGRDRGGARPATSSRRPRGGRGRDRHQQPRPRRLLASTCRRTYDLLADIPPGKTWCRSRASSRAPTDRGARGRGHRRRAGGRSAVMGPRIPRRPCAPCVGRRRRDARLTRARASAPPRLPQPGAVPPTIDVDGHDASARTRRGGRARRSDRRQPGRAGEGSGPRHPRPAGGLPRRGARADRGQPRGGQDRAGPGARALGGRRVRARPVHRRPAARRRGRARTSSTSARTASSSAPGRCSRTSCWWTRSTARRPRRSPGCSSACRSAT